MMNRGTHRIVQERRSARQQDHSGMKAGGTGWLEPLKMRLRLYPRKRGHGVVDHLMAAFVEFLSCRLACFRFIEREKEHSPCRAEPFLVARWVPVRAEAFRRKHDKPAAGFCDGVAAGFFKWAHEGRDSRTARANPGSGGNGGIPFIASFWGRAVSLEWCQSREVQDIGIPVGEPSPAQEFHGLDSTKELRIGLSRPGSSGILPDIAAKGGELAGLLDDPVMPIGGEDILKAGVTAFSKTILGVCAVGVLLRRAAALHHAPVFFGELARNLPHYDWKGLSLSDIFYLHNHVNMVRHHNKGRDFFDALPLRVEGSQNVAECASNVAFHEPVRPDLGKRLKPFNALKGCHVEERRLVIKVFETKHGRILPYSSERKSA